MVGGNVQQLEIELFRLDLRCFIGDEAELRPDARDLTLCLNQWMQRAARQRPTGKSDVCPFTGESDVEGNLLEARAPGANRLLELFANWVGDPADFRSILSRQLADAAKQLTQLALAPEVGALYAVKLGGIVGFLDSHKRTTAEIVELSGE